MAKNNLKKKKRRNLIIFILIVVIGVIAAIAMTNRGVKPIEVQIEKAGKRTITQTVSAVGKIEAETEVKVSPETSGEVVYVGVEEGDTVKSGQLLIRIKPDIVQTMLEQYKASVEAAKMDVESVKERMQQAQSELKRAQDLYRDKYVSQQEFDNYNTGYQQSVSSYKASLARLDQTLASYRQTQKSAERTVIYSTMSGVVTSKNVEKGETVLGTQQFQGTEMLRISDLSVMNAVVEVDENDIVLIKKGDTAKIEIDALPDIDFKGVVVEIGHSAIVTAGISQDQSTNFKVKVRLINPNPRLRPGMTCNADITTETKYDVMAVPLQSVTIRRDIKETSDDMEIKKVDKKKEQKETKDKVPMVVFVKNKDKVKMVSVNTGISDEGYIEITSGLKGGEEVVSGSFQAISKELSDGCLIKLEDKNKKKDLKKK
jgi:HlyD family secretion protein